MSSPPICHVSIRATVVEAQRLRAAAAATERVQRAYLGDFLEGHEHSEDLDRGEQGTDLHVRDHLCSEEKTVSDAAQRQHGRGRTHHRSAQPVRRAGRGTSCCLGVNGQGGEGGRSRRTFRAVHGVVSMLLTLMMQAGGRPRGIPPAACGGRADKGKHTSLAMVVECDCGWRVGGLGKGGLRAGVRETSVVLRVSGGSSATECFERASAGCD